MSVKEIVWKEVDDVYFGIHLQNWKHYAKSESGELVSGAIFETDIFSKVTLQKMCM